ncbi:MAG TPA: metal-sensitive transcriptional regulator [bacterium]|nr:metal-sensitive transcriptional regulator [bacterium]
MGRLSTTEKANTLVQVDDEVRLEHEALVARLRRVEGQIRGLQRLLEEGASCEVVAQQLFAAKAALEKIGVRLFVANMRSCLSRDLAGDTNARRALDRITEVFARLA